VVSLRIWTFSNCATSVDAEEKTGSRVADIHAVAEAQAAVLVRERGLDQLQDVISDTVFSVIMI